MTGGEVRVLLTGDRTPLKQEFEAGKQDAKVFRDGIGATKARIDGDSKPFEAAIARAEASAAAFDAKMTALNNRLVKANQAQADAAGRVRVAQEQLNAVVDKGDTSAVRLAAAEERLAAAQRAYQVAQTRTIELTQQINTEQAKASDAASTAATTTEKLAEAEKKTSVESEGLKGKLGGLTAALGIGLPAAAVVGGAVVGAALGGVGLVFTGVAAMALRGNDDLRKSWKDTANTLINVSTEAAAPMAGPFQEALTEVSRTARDVEPQLAEMFLAARPAVGDLTTGVLGLATNALPGMRAALYASQPVTAGLRDLLIDTGKGVSDLFQNASTGAPAAGNILRMFGGVAHDALGFVGSLSAELANDTQGSFSEFAGTLRMVEQDVLQLAQGALPILNGALSSGFSAFTSVLHVLEPVAPLLGQVVGIMLSGAGAVKIFSLAWDGATNAIKLFSSSGSIANGLTGLAGKVEDVSGKLASFAENGGMAAGAAGKLAGAGSSLSSTLGAVAGGLPIVGVGLAAIGALYATLAIQQQQIAEEGKKIAQGFADGGSQAIESANKIAQYGKTIDDLSAKRQALLDYQQKEGDVSGQSSEAIGRLNDEVYASQQRLDAASQEWQKLLSTMDPVKRSQAELNRALAQFGEGSSEATAAAAKYNSVVHEQETAQRLAAEATKTATDRLLEQRDVLAGNVNANLAYRQATAGAADSAKNLADTVKQHGVASMEARDASLSYESALQQQITAAGNLAIANYSDQKSAEAHTAATSAQNREVINLAVAMGQNAPPLIQQWIAGMTNADLTAQGASRSISDTGAQVIKLPNGKTVTISAETTAASGQLDVITAKLAGMPSQKYIDVITRYAVQGTSAAVGGNVAMAPALNASGRIMEWYAGGGMRNVGMVGMAAGAADIVQSFSRTGVMRVIGDNPSVPEAYIPLDPRSSRSQQILDETLARMRPAAGVGAASAGGGVASSPVRGGDTHVFNIVADLPGAVRREINLALRERELLHG